jgi:hypothetical protein
VPDTCKSNEGVFVAIQGRSSGEWVSNTLVTCPEEGDNTAKVVLIPHVIPGVRSPGLKGASRFGRGLRPIS